MDSPLHKIVHWVHEEKELGNIFSRGAVLCTVAKNGLPTSRVVGTMFDSNNIPKFFTSPNSRKVDNIKLNKHVSLTYSFHNTLRSISIEGTLVELVSDELDRDWLLHDSDFRRHYMIFGDTSGSKITSLDELRKYKDMHQASDITIRPKSFIGYTFSSIDRVSFYSVKENDFAINDVYICDKLTKKWSYSLLVP